MTQPLAAPLDSGLELPPYQSRTLSSLKTFRIAVAAAGEFTQYHGGTVGGAAQAIQTMMARINEIYQRDLGIRLDIVTNNHLVIFTDPITDPFSVNGATIQTIDECQATLDSQIGNSNYDLGIVLNTGDYGLTHLRIVCDPSRKGKACMGFSVPSGEHFALLVAHEIAHQFGANHSFNSPDGLCSGRRNEPSAVEPGAGSTMMSYAVVTCGQDSLQNSFDPYFHARSIAEISTFVAGTSCAITQTLSNYPPIVSAPSGFTIPSMTPFVLQGSAFDPDGNTLLFCWEQMDTGPAQTLGQADNGYSPLFRSRQPSTNSLRVFPNMSDLLANLPTSGERLPTSRRTMNFQLTVRDGLTTRSVTTQVFVTNSAPFQITSHNQTSNCVGLQTITWDVAGTTNTPFNVQSVNILLSTNGGVHFNHMLASNILNDGLEMVSFPSVRNTNARLKVEAVGNIFFDVNNAALSISPPLTISWALENEELVLRWPTRPGKQYRLEGTAPEQPTSWSALTASIVAYPNEMEGRIIIDTNRVLFMRVREF